MGSQHHRRRALLLGLALLAAVSRWTTVNAEGEDVEPLKERLIALLNAERVSRGLPALRRVHTLESAAQSYSETMRRATGGGPIFLAHLGPDGTTLGQRASAAGYHWYSLGETLAAGQKNPEQVIEEWLSSPLHRQNLLSREYRDIGVGIAVGPGTWTDGRYDPTVTWWAVNLGASSDSGPPDGGTQEPPPISQPGPSVTGYTLLDGTSVRTAQFGTLLMITGENLGFSGTVRFHGRPASALTWSPTRVMVWVPLQPSYPDIGPVTITVASLTALGPDFMTLRPGLAPATPTPGTSPRPDPHLSTGGSLAPSITSLANGRGERVETVSQGQLLRVRGKGFGTNANRKGRVLFMAPDRTQMGAVIWSWADDSIAVFTPFVRGARTVAVQIDMGGATVTSNQVPLIIQ